MTELARAALARAAASWVRLHYVYPVSARRRRDPADGRPGKLLPYLDVPFQHASPRILKLMKRPAERREHARRASARGARSARTSPSAARSSPAFPARPKPSSRSCSRSSRKRSSTASAASPIRRSTARPRTRCPIRCRRRCKRGAARALHGKCRRRSAPRASRRKVGTDAGRAGRRGRRTTARSRARAADAPEIDGVVRIAEAPARSRAQFARVDITAADEHDLRARSPARPLRRPFRTSLSRQSSAFSAALFFPAATHAKSFHLRRHGLHRRRVETAAQREVQVHALRAPLGLHAQQRHARIVERELALLRPRASRRSRRDTGSAPARARVRCRRMFAPRMASRSRSAFSAASAFSTSANERCAVRA